MGSTNSSSCSVCSGGKTCGSEDTDINMIKVNRRRPKNYYYEEEYTPEIVELSIIEEDSSGDKSEEEVIRRYDLELAKITSKLFE